MNEVEIYTGFVKDLFRKMYKAAAITGTNGSKLLDYKDESFWCLIVTFTKVQLCSITPPIDPRIFLNSIFKKIYFIKISKKLILIQYFNELFSRSVRIHTWPL
jgi:hypothetical protein